MLLIMVTLKYSRIKWTGLNFGDSFWQKYRSKFIKIEVKELWLHLMQEWIENMNLWPTKPSALGNIYLYLVASSVAWKRYMAFLEIQFKVHLELKLNSEVQNKQE